LHNNERFKAAMPSIGSVENIKATLFLGLVNISKGGNLDALREEKETT